jgi:hypothetical protein
LLINNNTSYKRNITKNYSDLWRIFRPHPTTVNLPPFALIPPQTYRQNTVQKTQFFQNPLQKSQQKAQKSPGNRRDFFSAKIQKTKR